MNVVPHFARCLIAMIVCIMASSHLAVASDTANGATFRLAMGPMSAAQKNLSCCGIQDRRSLIAGVP